jgi:hypothetical protein
VQEQAFINIMLDQFSQAKKKFVKVIEGKERGIG